ncbi:MAG TPA: nucleotidyltransferase family protein [Candidatus Saccharimonadales bacterium]|nr:nucleotidyltransferase family protein [Candidatus Saccharimonadales bacterium]
MTAEAAVVVLAAGEGRRAGGPKAWRRVAGRPWLAVQLEALERAADPPHRVLAPVVVVLAQAPPPEFSDLFRQARWAHNPRPERGPFSSLQIGLREAAGGGAGTAFVLPVDVPVPGGELFETLLQAVGAALAAVPECDGRGGHPVLLSAAAASALAALDPADPDARLDRWLRARGPQVRRVATADRRVLQDLNRVEDFEAP